ncbi:MAG: FAD-dependent oxidoreductase [Pseudomonadota bacterium]
MERPDILIIGGGVFGLATARACLVAGARVMLVERAHPGSGASGTPVGALVPMGPEPWSPIKALQLAGLRSLPGYVSTLEAETGLGTGYAKTGRILGLPDREARARAARQCNAAGRWDGAGTLRLLDKPEPSWAGLLSPEARAAGLQHDSLSARIDPTAYLEALVASVARLGALRLGARCTRLTSGGAEIEGTLVSSGAVVLATGAESAAWIGHDLVGEKGQAAELEASLPANAPVITAPGLYIVPHGPGRVAVGSTAERTWSSDSPDALLDGVIAKARALCPALAEAPVRHRWAGIRPRAPRAGPLVGPVPGRPGLWLATGGYKIGFALAHLVGEVLAAGLTGAPMPPAAANLTPIETHWATLNAQTAGNAHETAQKGRESSR